MQFLKSYLTDYINTYVFEYFDNISKEQITTQLSKGSIQLTDMQFKPSIFKTFNLPLTIQKNSMIKYISISLGKQSSIKIDSLDIVIEILDLNGNCFMENSIKLQILDKFKNSLVENLLKGMATQDKQYQDPKQKFIFKLIQNMEVELTNINITFTDKYCTQNSFGLKLEHLTCKSAQNQQQKLRNIEIKNLQLFWQDPVSQLNSYATLEDVSGQNSDSLAFQLGIVFDNLIFNCSKIQCNSMYRFSEYVSQFIRRQNQKVEKSENQEKDVEIKGEIKNLLKNIPLTEPSTSCQGYEKLCELTKTQSINDLKQLQFEVLKYDKVEEISKMRQTKLGWFGAMLGGGKKMEEKIINLLDQMDQDPNVKQQYLKSLQLKFELVIHQCQLSLSSIYRGQLNQLIINFKNVSMQMSKTNQLQLDFIIKEGEVLLQYQDKVDYLVCKNKNFDDKYSLELHVTNDDKKESLQIQTCPFQIVFNQEAFEKYYDLFYFFVVSENQIPKLKKKAQEQIQDIVNDKKEKDIQLKLEKIYIISTNGKETFLFSPGFVNLNYRTSDQCKYQIKFSNTTFGFSETITSCINFINQEYCFNSIIINRDFNKITQCDIDLVIQVLDNQIKTQLQLGDLSFQINPMIYKYFYQFYGTHFQQPLKELKNQLLSNEENQPKICYFSNAYTKDKIKCRFTCQQNILNIYEIEKNEKIMKIDLQNMYFKEYTSGEFQILELKINNQILRLDFTSYEDRQTIINRCKIQRDDDYYLQNILEQNQIENQKVQEQYKDFQSSIEINLNSIYITVLGNLNQPCININLTHFNCNSLVSQYQYNVTIQFYYFSITKEFDSQNNYFDDKKIIEIQNDNNQNIVEYHSKLNEDSTIRFYVSNFSLNYRALTIGQILEEYPILLKQDWNITKFIINSYLTYYPDVQIICNEMKVEINMKSVLFKKSELKYIKFQQNHISIMFSQDIFEGDCLQLNGQPKGLLIVNQSDLMTIKISLNQAQAIFIQQHTLQTRSLRKKSTKKILFSYCDVHFDWQLRFETNQIKNSMNFRINQLQVTLGTKVICYLFREFKKLSNQITEFYKSHDIASYLIQYREKTYSLCFGVETLVQVVFIDDCFSSSSPIFGIILEQPILKLNINQNDITFFITNQLELKNYHSVKLAWEPIIEPIQSEFEFSIQNIKPKIKVEFKVQEIFNINISLEFIQNLLKFKKLIKQFQINEKNQVIEPINQTNAQILTYETYELVNFSGLLIVAQGEDKELIELTNFQKKITKCKGTYQFDIYGINSTIKIQNWSLNLQKKRIIQEKGISLIIETIVDEFMNSSKTIISSNIILINLTHHSLQIQISHQEILTLDQGIRQQQFQKFLKYPNIYIVPNQYQKGSLCILEKNLCSEVFSYSDISQKIMKDNSQILSVNNKFYRLKCVHDPILKERSIISITPVIEFVNQTPFIIQIDKHCPQIKQFVNFKIMQNQIVEDYEINPQKEYLFSFTVNRYYQSIQYTFEELMKGKKVSLDDEKWQLNNYKKNLSLILLIKPKVDNYGRHQLIIQFDQSYLINNTDLDLIFYQGVEKNLDILGGQKQNTSVSLIVLQKIQDNHILIFEERNTNLKTQPLKLSEIITTEFVHIQKKEKNYSYFIPLQIQRNVIQMGDYTIPYFEIYYQYVIVNRLDQLIHLCYDDKVILLEPQIKVPLQIWNQNLLNDPDLPYEYSLKIQYDNQMLSTARFNIIVQQQFIILIRSINLCKRQFLKINVLIQNKQNILIIDKIENEQDYPYMIINESKTLQIQLKQDNETLIYGGRFPLANSHQSNQEFTYPVNLMNQNMQQSKSLQFNLKLDQIGLTGIVELNGYKYEFVVIQVAQQKQFIFTDFQKVSESQLQQQIEKEKIKYNLEFIMIFLGCQISYIENLQYKCKELALCFLENISMHYQSNEFNQQYINFKMLKLQIDSQSKQMSQKKTILFSEVQQNQNSMEFELQLDFATSSHYLIDSVKINFGNFQFCMDQTLKEKCEKIQAQLYELIFQQSIQNQLFKLKNQKLIQKKVFKNSAKQQVQIFVRQLILCPMEMKIYYLKDTYQLKQQHFIQKNFYSSPSNLFHKIIKKYVFGNSKSVMKMVAQYLSNQLMINPTKLNNWNAIRIKRAIYESTRLYKVFNKEQALHQQTLKQAKKCDSNIQFSKLKFIIISSHEIIQKGQNKIFYICDQQIFTVHNNLISNYFQYENIKLVFSEQEILNLIIICETEELILFLEDQENLQVAVQNLTRFQK